MLLTIKPKLNLNVVSFAKSLTVLCDLITSKSIVIIFVQSQYNCVNNNVFIYYIINIS